MYVVKSSQSLILKEVLMHIGVAAIKLETEKARETHKNSPFSGSRLGNMMFEAELEKQEADSIKEAYKHITDHINRPINLDAIAGFEKDESLKDSGLFVIHFHGTHCLSWKYTDISAYEKDYKVLEGIFETNTETF